MFISRLDQYAVDKFAEGFEVVPRTLAENAGLDITEIISSLYSAHAGGNHLVGIDVDGGGVFDITSAGVWDLFPVK